MRPRKPVIALGTVLVALVLTLTACGGDENTTTTPAPSPAAPGGSEAPPSLSSFPPSFLECLEDQGIDPEAVGDLSEAIHSPGGDRCFEELHGG